MACVVTWLKKGTDDRRIAELADLANAQQSVAVPAKPLGPPAEGVRSKLPIFPFDTMITPWQSKFGGAVDWHFVAQAPDGRICGWLTAQLKQTDFRRYIYLAEISTRRIRDEVYGGVGTRLHDALVDAARAGGYDFIYLYPVNAVVASIYEKWGYSPSSATLPYQFYVINRGPTVSMKTSFRTPRLAVDVSTRARELIGPEFDAYRRAVLANGGRVEDIEGLLNEFEVENAAAERPERVRRPKQLAEMADAEKARLEKQQTQLREFLQSLKTEGGLRKTARNTHRLRFFRKHHLPVHGYSLGELSKVSKVSQPILQQVYDRGIGAYKTNPTSVRMKGTFRKGVRAPYSKKLSKEQWAMARVYSFLDGNPKHDTDLRRKTRRRNT